MSKTKLIALLGGLGCVLAAAVICLARTAGRRLVCLPGVRTDGGQCAGGTGARIAGK